MKFTGIKETCLYIHDLELARAFYHDQLGLPVIGYAEGKHIFFRAGRSVLLCFNPDDSRNKQHPPAHFGSGKQHFAFEVRAKDYEQSRKEITSKGIAIIDTLTWQSGRESFYFNDPEGNVLEIVPDREIWD